jgi:transcriptional regulator NrdR family protein
VKIVKNLKMDEETKEIYREYIESIIDNIKDYVRATKCEDINKCSHWKDMFEMVETFRVDMLSVVEELK